MAETFEDRVSVTRTGSPDVTIILDGDGGNVVLGDNTTDGDLTLKDASGTSRVHINGDTNRIRIRSSANHVVAELGHDGDLRLGGEGLNGDIYVYRNTNQRTMHIDGGAANLWIGGNGADGDIVLFPNGVDNSRDTSESTIWIDADNRRIQIRDGSGNLIAELGGDGDLRLGGQGLNGDIRMYRNTNQQTVHLDAGGGNLWMGGNGVDGDIVLFPRGVAHSHETGDSTIHLDGDAGDIILRNADCAEEFDVVESEAVDAGTVLVLDDEGKLRPCQAAYDKRVVGIVSGGNGANPGIVLGRQRSPHRRLPVALNGRVYCKVDARSAPVQVGDLLTTSPTPGHAMKAADPGQAFGTVIGKALKPLHAALGMIPVLVALQ